jgi:lipoate-protein ligase A
MAIDEATLALVAEHRVPPTVRIYSWEAPCYSIGYLQHIAPLRSDLLHHKDFRCVRRLTGGRAFLHGGDLSYSVVLSQADTLLPSDVISSYERISSGVIEGLRLMGIDARYAPPVEVQLDGYTIATAAQARRQGVILHQGTIALTPCGLPGGDVLLKETLRPVSELVGGVIDLEEGARALGMGLTRALGVDLSPGVLFAKEKRLARQLWREKYVSPEWTFSL